MKSQSLSLLSCLIMLSLTVMACQDDNASSQSSAKTAHANALNLSDLGTLQGKLRLPQDQECSVFTAYQMDGEEERELFEINVEQAQVRNNSYSFLQDLPQGNYQMKGRLSCTSTEGEIEHESLHDEVSIVVNQVAPVQFRFFFDVENDLSQVDLKFCADLALRSLSPAVEACPGEHIMGQYAIDWLREDCGEIFLQLTVDEATFESQSVTFPSNSLNVSGFAPERLGAYELMIAISAPSGGQVELHHSMLEVVACNEELDDEDLDEVSLVCDSEEMLNQLAEMDMVHSDVTHYLNIVRELFVMSLSDALSEEERTQIKEDLEVVLAELNDMLDTSDLDITPEPMEIRCTFSDLNGLCGDTDRSFAQDLSSLMEVMDQLESIDLENLEVADVSLVDELLVSVSLSRVRLGGMFERFSILMAPVSSEEDLYGITLNLMNQQQVIAMISVNDTSTDQDREFLNELFTQLRDESVRLNACHSCSLNLAEMDLADCDAGSCLSIETQEQATEALEGVEIMMEQVNECLAE